MQTERNPDSSGLQESSRWSESAETTGNVILIGSHPGGVQDLYSEFPTHLEFHPKIFRRAHLAPLRGAIRFLTVPVVSADSDHRLLSLQPFGLR